MGKKKRDNKHLDIEDRYEEVRQLLILGKDRGYLAFEEINELLPDELNTSPEEIEEVFSLLETHGIELVDAETKEQLTDRARTAGDQGQGGQAGIPGRPAREDQRPGADVPARDGHRAAVDPRGRGLHRPAHRAR